MAEVYTPTLIGKDGLDFPVASSNGSTNYLANTWLAAKWIFAADAHPLPKVTENTSYTVNPIVFSDWELIPTSKDGANATELFAAATYTGNAWKDTVWNFSADKFPELKPAEPVVYPVNPIDFSVWRVNELLMNGADIPADQLSGDVHYLGNTWTVLKWTFDEKGYPLPKNEVPPVYAVSPIDFSIWKANELLRDGDSLRSPADKLAATYTATFWKESVWNFADNQLPELKAAAAPEYITPSLDFSPWAFSESSKEGADYDFEAATSAKTYSDFAGWRFDRYWHIMEGKSFPILINEIPIIELGVPLQSEKKFVFIEPSELGDIMIQDQLYTLSTDTVVAEVIAGAAGEIVVHEFGGERLKPSELRAPRMMMRSMAAPTGPAAAYTFLASAVEEPTALGGYTNYSSETERAVTLREDAGSNVNFYYVLQTMPDYDYLVNIPTTEGVAHIAVAASNVSNIKMRLPDGSIGTFQLVPVDNDYASPIRVLTADGVFALVDIPQAVN